MKELNKLTKPKIEEQVKKQQQIERERIGIIIPHEGHTVFEINKETGNIQKAMYIKKDIVIGDLSKPKDEVLVREGYNYVSALNKKNALKKYKKGQDGSKPRSGLLDLDDY